MRNYSIVSSRVDEADVESLAKELNLHPLVARHLWLRQIRSAQQYQALIAQRPLSSPWDLPQMEAAVELLRWHLERGLRIRIYGDYDADGVTATAVLLRGLRAWSQAGQVDFRIPNRFDEGYGLHLEAVQEAAQDQVACLVTVDCGSSSPAAAELARDLGVRLVITDHHSLSAGVPRADVVVNPELMTTPNRLSGAGVALQLVRALAGGEVSPELYAIAAVGTVADIVPLVGDNRQIVRLGLEAIGAGKVAGISALMQVAKRDAMHPGADDLGFALGPRLNAAGRMGDADPAVQLLLTDDVGQAQPLAEGLEAANLRRREIEQEVLTAAWAQLGNAAVPDFVVVAGDGWHHGVIGIVASRLKDVLKRPVAVIGWDGDSGRGSARSVEGLHLARHLRRSSQWFTRLGGHPGAAGFSLPRQEVQTLAAALSQNLPSELRAQRFWGTRIDGRVDVAQLDPQVQRQFEELRPYGHGFDPPRWLLRGPVEDLRVMGQDARHLAFWYGSGMKAVAFGQGARARAITPGAMCESIGKLEWSTWQGRVRRELRVETLLHAPALADVGTRCRYQNAGDYLEPGARVVWMVDGMAKLGHDIRAFDWRLPLGDLGGIEECARRGVIRQIAVSQWRPLPHLWEWADHVVWQCPPASPRHLEAAAALLAGHGQMWMNPTELAPMWPRTRAKWRRLVPDRTRMGRLWRSLQAGAAPLLPGRLVLKELELDPSAPADTRRRLEESPSYAQARQGQQWAEAHVDYPWLPASTTTLPASG